MKEITGDLFQLMGEIDVSAICIMTNGIVNKSRENIMGAGTAGEAANKWPDIRKRTGWCIETCGNVPSPIGVIIQDGSYLDPANYYPSEHKLKFYIFSFPTKNDYRDLSS